MDRPWKLLSAAGSVVCAARHSKAVRGGVRWTRSTPSRKSSRLPAAGQAKRKWQNRADHVDMKPTFSTFWWRGLTHRLSVPKCLAKSDLGLLRIGNGSWSVSRIFISHSSRDTETSISVREWLAGNGWNDVFLDLDPSVALRRGGAGGRNCSQSPMRELILALVSGEAIRLR
jgi:hypothetical protein